jgi:hypothetical protein
MSALCAAQEREIEKQKGERDEEEEDKESSMKF